MLDVCLLHFERREGHRPRPRPGLGCRRCHELDAGLNTRRGVARQPLLGLVLGCGFGAPLLLPHFLACPLVCFLLLGLRLCLMLIRLEFLF